MGGPTVAIVFFSIFLKWIDKNTKYLVTTTVWVPSYNIYDTLSFSETFDNYGRKWDSIIVKQRQQISNLV